MTDAPASDAADNLRALPWVVEKVGLSKTMIYRMIREQRFPAPYKPGGAASRWSELEVLAWRRTKMERPCASS